MTSGVRAIVLGGALAVCAGCAAARGGNTAESLQPHAHFLDQSYIFIPNRPAGLLYEGQAAANIVFTQTLARAGTDVRMDAGRSPNWHWAHMLTMTPRFVIRQLEDSSAAVRTPSFMPKATYQLFRMKKATRDTASPNVNRWKHVDLQLADFVFGHYSNGQAGCFFERQRFVPGGAECVWLGNDSTNRAINYSDGSFSTWYLRAGLGAERLWGFGGDGAPANSHIGGLLSLQYQLPFLTEDDQRPLYGDWRVRAQAEYEKSLTRLAGGVQWRVGGLLEHALDAGPDIPRTDWSAETSLTFDRLYGIGAFVRRHGGQDYYNIAFTNRLEVWQVGVTIRLDRPDTFSR
jgi:hypothetical protein